MRATWIAVLCLSLVLGLTGLAQAQYGSITGLYVNETNPNASIKIKHIPAKEGVKPSKNIRGVFKYKDPANPQDSCMFEFHTTMEKAPSLILVDDINKHCLVRGELLEGKVNVTVSADCMPVYCKGAAKIPAGMYVKQPRPAEEEKMAPKKKHKTPKKTMKEKTAPMMDQSKPTMEEKKAPGM
jgi:hypothetical protein